MGGGRGGEALAAYRAAYAQAMEARRDYDRVREARSASAASLEEARFTLRQIDGVGLIEGEYDDLVAYLDKAEHAEVLARAAHGAYAGLSGEGLRLTG